MIKDLRHLWTPKRGVFARCRDKRGQESFRVCCGRASNPYLVAERCRIWNSDGSQAYAGPMTAEKLFELLENRSVATVDYCATERGEKLKTRSYAQ